MLGLKDWTLRQCVAQQKKTSTCLIRNTRWWLFQLSRRPIICVSSPFNSFIRSSLQVLEFKSKLTTHLVTFFLASDKQGCWENIHARNISNAPLHDGKAAETKKQIPPPLSPERDDNGRQSHEKECLFKLSLLHRFVQPSTLNVASCQFFCPGKRARRSERERAHSMIEARDRRVRDFKRHAVNYSSVFWNTKVCFFTQPNCTCTPKQKSNCTLLCVLVWRVCFHEHFHRDLRRMVI